MKKENSSGAAFPGLGRMALIMIVILCLMAVRTGAGTTPPVDEILDRLEARYDNVSVTARFEQLSTLKVMDITDTAAGLAFFKPPGMMRWEYETPEPQQIITDGKRLWIYKPNENQVVVGQAPALFGENSGINLFAGIGSLRRLFNVSPAPERGKPGRQVLKLIPVEKTSDLSEVYITISTPDHDLVEIETVNPYGDTTIIAFREIVITEALDNHLFVFEIPVDADVIHLDNQQ